MLALLIPHLRDVGKKADVNMMGVKNLAVCFGPTLLFPRDVEEGIDALGGIKYGNIVVSTLIEKWQAVRAVNKLTLDARKLFY